MADAATWRAGTDERIARGLVCAALLTGAAAAITQAAPTTQESGAGAQVEDPAAAAREGGAENNPAADEMTDALIAGIDRGLEFLALQQNADGSFGRGLYGRHVGISALCGIAFMADGNVPGRGRYGEQVARTLEFVLANQTDAGLLSAETTHGPMYGHGFAALFLGEVYGMTPGDRRIHDALVRAVDLIVGTQNEEGGWRYNPIIADADISVTITQIMALRSARNAGIKVPVETIDRAVRYVRECQNPDGGFRYMRQPGSSAWPRTAAGVASLYYAGIYDDDSIRAGLDWLIERAMPGRNSQSPTHYFYGQYYAVQAMYLAGGTYWSAWWPAIREELLARQSSSGSWHDHYASGAYSTAMGLIVLQMPKRYLPIFQK